MPLTYSYLSDRHSGRWIICQQKCFNLTAKNLQWNIHPHSFHYFKGILCVPLFWMLFGNILWKQYRGNVSPFAGELRPQKDPEEKTALINTMHYNVSQNVITICKTFPEAQRTQGIESHMHWFQIWPKCISSKFDHQVAPLALVPNLADCMWFHLY